MSVDVYLPFVLSLLFGVAGPRLARRLPPAGATWLLSLGGLALAASTVLALGLLAWTVLAQQPAVAAAGHWTVRELRRLNPVELPVAVAAAAVIPVLAFLVVRVALRRATAIAHAYRTCRELPGDDALVVLPEPGIAAYAVPGRPGRIVVSRSLLTALSPAHRRTVLAHEQAHLDHRHYVHLTAVAVAAAVNPLLARLPAAVAYTTERWADEDAAASGRATAADALARAGALARSAPTAALHMAATHVPARIAALRADPPRPRLLLTGLAVGVVVCALAFAGEALLDSHQLIELAQRRSR